ncbi:hypothetical protein QTP70_020170 [Hemibagrus guttatus]|uniref:Uncharacterized protein n=1 Tax=Hemibagrus guttatus TaxID=175788 RepID=A0AAE0RHA0_9TELE|nr:hypothetical protein QTP70_020170 [Hemibagrus guttatus]KAK3573910.1 hypothetical protein QTP86_033044 [Hemibagrus guttatus]
MHTGKVRCCSFISAAQCAAILRFGQSKLSLCQMSSLVTVRYGPYESCGVVNHKTFRLEGMQAVLRDCGYVCVLEEAPDWNQVELVVHGESVYKCDINSLEFGNKTHNLNPRSINHL